MSILFKNITVVKQDHIFLSDVLVCGETIAQLSPNIPASADWQVIEGEGKLLLPGAIDCHTHLALDVGEIRSTDDYFTGTRSAACGGTTTIFDYPLQQKGEQLVDCARRTQQKISSAACVDYGIHVALSDLSGDILDNLGQCIDFGVTSFKAYMVYDFSMTDTQIEEILRRLKQHGGLLAVHAEDKGEIERHIRAFLQQGKTQPLYHYLSRPEEVETAAVRRLVDIARRAGSPLYIVHLACEEGVTTVREAKAQGVAVIAETCPQYLHFTNEVYTRPDALDFICSPPIKGEASQRALWQGIADGTISTIGTDHCPFTRHEKLRGAQDFSKTPNGCAGIETMYPYLLSCANEGKLSFSRAVALCSYNVAKIFGCSDSKGEIAVGKDADLVLYDPTREVVIRNCALHGATDHTIWEGVTLRGYPEQVYLRGRLVCDSGRFVGERGFGKFLRCASSLW